MTSQDAGAEGRGRRDAADGGGTAKAGSQAATMRSTRLGQRARSAQSDASSQPAHSNLALSIQVAEMRGNCLQGLILCQQSGETQDPSSRTGTGYLGKNMF